MPIGGVELLLLVVLVAIPVWGMVDAALRPDTQWRRADQSKIVWILVQLFLSIVGSIVYFAVIHPRLIHAAEEGRLINRRDRRTIDRAVSDAEARTGLQFCVYLGPAEREARAHAEGLFVRAGLHERPAVLLLVAPDHHRVEIVTAPEIATRLSDEACARAIDAMAPLFGQGQFVQGLVVGIRRLAEEAGPGPGRGADLPNIVEE